MTEAAAAPAGSPAEERPAPSRAAWAGLAALCGAAAALFALYWTPYAIDDPWITYRYAEYLAEGRGFVFNEGERVQGTSTPLYALLLAAAHFVGLPVPGTSWTLNFAGMIWIVAGTFLLARRFASDGAALAGAALMVAIQVFHRVSTYGMETPVYVGLIVGTFVAYASGRRTLAGVLAGLCVVMRVDGGAVGAALLASELVFRRSVPWRPLLACLAVSVPWFAFAAAYFDGILPATMSAKRAHTDGRVMTWLPKWILDQPFHPIAAFGCVRMLLPSADRRLAFALLAWGGAYAAAFTLGGVQGYDWYLMPLCPLLAVGAAAGLGGMASAVTGSGPAARIARAAVLAGIPALVAIQEFQRIAERRRGVEGVRGAEAYRLEAARWMNDNLPADAVIVTGGIGHVGYFTRRRVLDAMGLVSPQVVASDGPVDDPTNVPFARFLPRIVRERKPEWVFDGFWLDEGEDVPPFMKGEYEVVKRWAGPDPLCPAFVLMRRIADDERR